MSSSPDPFPKGYSAFVRGDLETARGLLQKSSDVRSLHLLGLVEKRAGNLSQARSWLARAAQAEPRNHELWHNRALVELQCTDAQQAEQFARQALALNATFGAARLTLARALLYQRRFDDSAALYQERLDIEPGNVPARYGLATIALETGSPGDAEQQLTALLEDAGPRAQFFFMRGRARLELGDIAAGNEDLELAWQTSPDAQTLRVLANLYWMTGHKDRFRDKVMQALEQPELAPVAADLLRQAGDLDAATLAPDARRDASPDRLAVAALAAIDAEQAADAEALARKCLEGAPGHRIGTAALISALLMGGKAAEALACVASMRSAEPLGQHWIAYEASALRLIDPARYSALVRLEQHVRAYTLPVPQGYRDLDHFNSDLLKALDREQRYQTHPLDQSLRKGSQTQRDLRTMDEPAVQAYLRALDQPIRDYLQHIGNAADHPLTARNTFDYQFAGCWSVRLGGEGRHVNHVHPEGWISSAYYVCVPPETLTGDSHAGWIKFAEPPFPTTPASPPEKWLQPRAGQLVLFPSFLWHGTHAISKGATRVTAPFDLTPA